MAKELDNFIKNVCSASDWIAGTENHVHVLKIADVLRKSYRGDELKRPDGYYKEGNDVYMIEHFEFDSSKPFKGSLNKVELDRVNKDFNKVQKYYKDLVLRPLGNTLVGNRDFDINIEDINEYNIEVEDS